MCDEDILSTIPKWFTIDDSSLMSLWGIHVSDVSEVYNQIEIRYQLQLRMVKHKHGKHCRPPHLVFILKRSTPKSVSANIFYVHVLLGHAKLGA